MATPHELLASSLLVLKEVQENSKNIFKTSAFTRVHRERLLKNGFLKEVFKGWLMLSHPDERPGDSTSWYACFWDFCAAYCNDKFGEDWHFSPEQSLKIYAGATVIPSQVIVYSPRGGNNLLKLPFETSIYDLKSAENNATLEFERYNKLRLYKIEQALIKAPASFYHNNPLEAQICLAQIKNIAPLLSLLLEGGHSKVAGRLAAAFERIGNTQHAESIKSAMLSAGYAFSKSDPFEEQVFIFSTTKNQSNSEQRIQGLWESNRDEILRVFSDSEYTIKAQKSTQESLGQINDIYQNDAYHSLSIEGYQVSEDLINKVSSGNWDPSQSTDDRQNKNALAARGYWQAFQLVVKDLKNVLEGEDINTLVQSQHINWYRELFQPSVQVGFMPANVLSGYRNTPVYLRNSRHIPPRAEVVFEMMEHLFYLFKNEESCLVKAIMGHWLFGYIHPFPDGNGRIARFMMNIILTAGGYPWTIIQVESRNDYLNALECASVKGNIGPFAEFIKSQMES